MATEELKASVEEKLGDLNIKEKAPAEESEKFEDSKDSPVQTPKEAKEDVLDELKEGLPPLQHVETKDTTDTVEGDSTKDGVVKAEVPEAFKEELKSDHDIAPDATPVASESKETPAETVTKEVGEKAPATPETPVDTKAPAKAGEIGEKAPATPETPVETKAPAKAGGIGEKITQTFNKIVGKDSSS